jgi:hypothetical protein
MKSKLAYARPADLKFCLSDLKLAYARPGSNPITADNFNIHLSKSIRVFTSL